MSHDLHTAHKSHESRLGKLLSLISRAKRPHLKLNPRGKTMMQTSPISWSIADSRAVLVYLDRSVLHLPHDVENSRSSTRGFTLAGGWARHCRPNDG